MFCFVLYARFYAVLYSMFCSKFQLCIVLYILPVFCSLFILNSAALFQSFQNTIFKQTQRLEEKKSQMNWDNQALDAWLKECRRRDDDAMTLARYTREDEDKIRVSRALSGVMGSTEDL